MNPRTQSDNGMGVTPRLLYLATDVFSKGGIQRYSRTQIRALRELLGMESVTVLSLRSPGKDSIEEPFSVDYAGQGLPMVSRMRYVARAAGYSLRQQPDLIWTNHIALLPVGEAVRFLAGNAPTVANVYGWEMWSGLSAWKRRALCSLVLTDWVDIPRISAVSFVLNPSMSLRLNTSLYLWESV